MYHPLLKSILYDAWAISPESLEAHLPLIQALLSGDYSTLKPADLGEMRAQSQPRFYSMSGSNIGKNAEASGDSVAILPVQGVVTKNGGMWSMGSEEMAGLVRQWQSDDSIIGMVLDVDSPGGMVSGTDLLAEAISAFSQHKPAISRVSGEAQSAAYEIVSACSEVHAASPNDMFGSIGTLASFMDQSEYLAKKGIKEVTVYATQSTEKNRFSRLYSENPEAAVQAVRTEMLDPMNERFRAFIAEHRPGANIDEVGTGATYMAEDALKKGLIDGIGMLSLGQAVDRVIELHDQSQTSSNMFSIGKKNKSALPNTEQVLAAAVAGSEVAEETFSAANNELEAHGLALALTEQQAEQANALANAQKALEDANAALETAKQERDEWEAKATEYGKQPGEKPVTLPTQKTGDPGAADPAPHPDSPEAMGARIDASYKSKT